MEIINRIKARRKTPKLGETRIGIFSFICALLTLTYINIFLITLDGFDIFSNLFLQVIPTIGVMSALASFFAVNHRKTFAWWALGLYLFMFILVVVVGFFEFAIYPKP